VNPKRVLVTGGSGFIASHLVKRLLKDGHKVAITARYGNIVKCERLRSVWSDIEVIEADLRNRGALARAAAFFPEWVFHLAAYNHVGESFNQVEECFDVNAKGTANLLDCMMGEQYERVEKFVYMSTSEVYGPQSEVPFSEEMTPNPSSPYAVSKYAGELYCRIKQRLGDPVSIVRCFNTYGPWQSTKAIIPEVILKCLRNEAVRTTFGEQTREFVFVDDTVEGLIRTALDEKRFDCLNIGTGKEVSIKLLVQSIAKIVGFDKLEIGALRDRPNEIPRMYASTERMNNFLKWSPLTSLEDGLRLTVDWFKENLKHE
jgi:nucleoside-diphosphate-sugar epimerase